MLLTFFFICALMLAGAAVLNALWRDRLPGNSVLPSHEFANGAGQIPALSTVDSALSPTTTAHSPDHQSTTSECSLDSIPLEPRNPWRR